MPRRTIASHKKRDKLSNKLDNTTRARADHIDFLAEKAGEKKITRGLLIEQLCARWGARNGYKASVDDLAKFLADHAAERDTKRGALIEKVCMNWARRNGFQPGG